MHGQPHIRVTVVVRLQAGRNSVWFPARARWFSILQNFQSDTEDAPSVLSKSYSCIFPSCKSAEAWRDFIFLSSAEVGNEWRRSVYMTSLGGQRQSYSQMKMGCAIDVQWLLCADVCYVTWGNRHCGRTWPTEYEYSCTAGTYQMV